MKNTNSWVGVVGMLVEFLGSHVARIKSIATTGVLHSGYIVLHSYTVLYSVTQCYTVLHSVSQYYIVSHSYQYLPLCCSGMTFIGVILVSYLHSTCLSFLP